MTAWLVFAAVLALALVVATRTLEWHRYSRGHIAASFEIRGRGLYFSRTPDGVWWKLRMRRRKCGWTLPSEGGDPPPDSGVREPRRPPPSGPLATSGELDLPD